MNFKKSLISIAAVCCMCMGIFGGCSSSSDSGQNTASDEKAEASETSKSNGGFEAVKNDFEINYGGWTPTSFKVKLTAEDGKGNENSRGMLVSGRTGASDGATSVKGMYLKSGVNYTYSVMVYSDTAETFHFNLSCKDNFKRETGTELATAAVEAGKWTKLSAEYSAPENSGNFQLTLTTDSENDFRFDDVYVTTEEKPADENSEKGLKDEYANYFKFGNILNGGTVKDYGVLANVLKNYNSITCENEMKPDSTLVQPLCEGDNVAVSINKAAAIFDFCINNDIGVRGHVLVWHSQTPVWFFKENYDQKGDWVTPEVMDKRMESYIKNMFETIKTQYPDLDLYAYDVVNEAVSDDSSRGILYGGAREPGDNNVQNGKSAWVQVYGSNCFIEKAFVYARKYAPEGCKLFYNDYNEYWDHKRDKIYDICKNLYEKGLLDGIGMQTHVNADMNGFSSAAGHKAAMEKFLSIGCEVQITECDISCEGGKFSAEQQAEKAKAMVQAAVEYNKAPKYDGKVTAFCFWGPNDANTWISPENAPLLHDTENKPKAAYSALCELIPESEWGDGKNPVKFENTPKELNLDPTEEDKVTAVLAGDESAETEETASETADLAQPAGSGNYSDSFEGDMCGWFGRGSATVSVSDKTASDGSNSLFVEGRTEAWNGTSKLLSPDVFVPGSTCSFKVNIMYDDGGDTDTFYMKLQYTDASGAQQYASVAEGEAKKGEWLHLENASYEIPADAKDMQIYVETASSTINFYIDEAVGEPA